VFSSFGEIRPIAEVFSPKGDRREKKGERVNWQTLQLTNLGSLNQGKWRTVSWVIFFMV
jgi:hypothetical protein